MGLQKIIKSFILTAIALYLTTLVVPGFIIQPGIASLAITTLSLTLLNIFIRPIIKLLLLPVNLVTLGAFRWITNIILLYLLTIIIPEVSIQGFILSDIPAIGVLLPATLVGRFISTIIVSIVLSVSQGFLYWIVK